MKSETTPSGDAAAKAEIQIDLLAQLQHVEKQKRELQHQFDALSERFNFMLMATQDAVWDWDLSRNVGWYSEGLKILFGHDPRSIGDGVDFWYNTIHPDDRTRVVDGIHAVIDNGGKHWNDRYRFKRADGSYAWVFDRGYAIHDAEGTPTRMVGSMQDITTELEAREALRESEEKFRGAFDQVAVGISISTPDGKFLSVNDAYPKIFGYSKEELISKSISDISHPEEIEGDRKTMKELLSGKAQVASREKRYIHKSGKTVWGRVFGTVINDSNGAPKYVVGVLEDITEKRMVVQALQENEERMRLVIDAANIGIWDFNPLTGKLVWDARCKAMFGMTPEDTANYDLFLQLIHPEDRQHADEANRTAMTGIGSGEYDLEYRTVGLRDGKIRWVRAKGRSYKDDSGAVVRYAGTVIDITEEKKQEQLLREQEERFRLLATSIPQIVWTADEDGIVDYMSDKWLKYTAHTPTYEKFSFRDLMHPEDVKTVVAEWNNCMREGITFEGEYRLKNLLTDDYRWFSCTTVPLKDANDRVIKWIGSATDIHDQKMIEIQLENKVQERTEALRALNKQLEKSNSELEQYAYVTSHDLKEPLRKIQTYHNLIKTKYPTHLTPEVAEYLTRIESASSRMSGLIEDLLNYSRLSNPVVLLQPVDVNRIVQNVSAEFDHAIRQKNISVEVGELPVLRGVPFQIHQLFFNLFSNAIKFSKPETSNKITIMCSVLSEDEKASNHSLTEPGRHYKLVFQDEGIGFSSKYSEQIFTIFQRLYDRQKFEGHGIGLALCRKIVANHNGIIRATGEEGKGATFTIILPEGHERSQAAISAR